MPSRAWPSGWEFNVAELNSRFANNPRDSFQKLTHDAHLGKGSIVMPGGTGGSRNIAWWIRGTHACYSKVANGMGGSMAHMICTVHQNSTSVS